MTPQSATDHHNPVGPALPVLAASGAILSFGLMDAVMKALTLDIGLVGALFWRCGVAFGFAVVLFATTTSHRIPAPATLRLHLKRGVITAAMALLFFYGLARVPIAEAVAVTFVAPIIALYLAAVLLGERIGRRAMFASLLGFGGVLLIIGSRLGAEQIDAEAMTGLLAILGSAVLYAWNLILQRQQAQISSPQEITLFQNAIVTLCYGALMPAFGSFPSGASDWGLVFGGAVLSIISMMLFSWAYARAEAQVLVPIEYSMFIWGALFGWLFFAEPLGVATLAGAALIVAGCWIVARRDGAIAATVEKELAVAPGQREA